MIFSSLSISLLAFVTTSVVAYSLSENIVGSGFYNSFTFEAIPDPTNGRVNYVSQSTAQSKNLTFASANTFILRTDDTTVLSASGPGRNSVRIKTKNTYTTHAAVFDIRHMPEGCATWPAVWETMESNWPAGGEVDILEGVNSKPPNVATVHTSPGCTMPSSRTQTGTSGQLDCNTAVNSNTGCGVQFPTTNSFGPSFNSNGGGWYAIERTTSYIKVWFWPRNGGFVPAEVAYGASTVNPTSNWGEPDAFFPNSTTCDLADHFSANNIIINLTLCGDFAGNVFNQDGCSGLCVDYVNANPAAFQNAYFNFAAIRVYL